MRIRNLFNIRSLIGRIIGILYSTDFISDKQFLSFKFHNRQGYRIDWDNPITFSEKLQWLKLYNRRKEYTIMADKVMVKDWVARRIGSEYIIPTLGVWKRAEDVDFDSLPEQFVIKCNHNSGLGMYICRDKSKMDKKKVLSGLQDGLKENYFKQNGEWPYRDIPRRIIAEKFLSDGSGLDLADYKFFCFDGEPIFCQVIKDRSTKETIDFYDMNWVHQPFIGLAKDVEHSKTPVNRPAQLDMMISIVKKLAKGIPFVRVDLYVVGSNIYFGEITFFPASGMGSFRPSEWNVKFGNMIKLPYPQI